MLDIASGDHIKASTLTILITDIYEQTHEQ